MTASVVVFDAYGTLFDVAGAAREAAREPGRKALAEIWPKLAETWRRKQLEYTWLRAVTGAHGDFWTVTADALDYALEYLRINDADLRTRLRELYLTLPAFEDAEPMLRTLKDAGTPRAILSNGSPDMLGRAIRAAGLEGLFDAVLSVEQVAVFKPHRKVYDLVGDRFGARPRTVLFVSSNGWDAAAAAGYGFDSVWVNRAGEPMERLPWKPAHVVRGLAAVPALAATL